MARAGPRGRDGMTSTFDQTALIEIDIILHIANPVVN